MIDFVGGAIFLYEICFLLIVVLAKDIQSLYSREPDGGFPPVGPSVRSVRGNETSNGFLQLYELVYYEEVCNVYNCFVLP